MILELFVSIALIALICEWIDSSLGMGYGTILSPLLLLFGFSVSEVVPAILITQALGGFSAAIFHHRHGNAHFSFKGKWSEDSKTVLVISSLGVIAAIAAAFLGSIISKNVLTAYIGALVLVMGFLVLINFSFRYSTMKMVIVGIISAFNKGLSGGGFGPIVTGGQMVLGKEHKSSIACTTAAEPLICIAGFLVYLFLNGLSNVSLIFALAIGSLIAGPFGAITTKALNRNKLKIIVGVLMLVLGTLTLLKIAGVIAINLSI